MSETKRGLLHVGYRCDLLANSSILIRQLCLPEIFILVVRSCFSASQFSLFSRVMQGLSLDQPPAQFSLTLSHGLGSPIPVERLFRFFALESLVLDPRKTLYPIKLALDMEIDIKPSDWRRYLVDFEESFSNTHQYLIYIPEQLYGKIYQHCTCAFPDHTISCYGDGGLVSVHLTIKPMAYTDLVECVFEHRIAIDDLRLELHQARRILDLLYHNVAAIARDWSEVNPQSQRVASPGDPSIMDSFSTCRPLRHQFYFVWAN